jgi:diguanylate cyclase (GGDEF)-like protein/PAS domain S-box-containing protein
MATTTNNAEHASKPHWSNLPVKITVLVFWGLALFGSAIAVWVLSGLEQRLTEKYQSDADRVAYRLQGHFEFQPALAVAGLKSELEALRKELAVLGIKVELGSTVLQSGETGPELSVQRRSVTLHRPNAAGATHRGSVSVYHPSREYAINKQRRDLLIAMGVVLLLFGFGLVWVLQQLLTGPFTAMLNAAQAFSVGDVTQRFDDRREDEFGFLGKFINKALDQLLAQQAALFQEKERAEVTLHSIGDGVITTDAAGNVEYLNPVAETLTGWTLKEAHGLPLAQIMGLIDETSRQPVENPVYRCLREGAVVALADHAALVRRDSQELAIADSAAPIRDHSGEIIGAVMVFHDVAQARKLTQQLSYQASHDALTDLPNRTEFERQLEAALISAKNDGHQHVLCYLDLDQFKIVNDTCGHVAGDELLRQITGMLHSTIRETDVLARLGGDEFGILLRHCDSQRAPLVAESLCKAVKDFRFLWGEHSFETGVSIGLVAITADSLSVSEVLSTADVACYAAKDKGRNQVHVHQPDDKELEARRGEMQWVSRIRRAIDENRFCLYYQPIVPIDAHGGGELHRELLIRLRDEQGRIVPPMAFIPAAERYGLMPDIDRWVIRSSFRLLGAQCSSDCNWICTINLSGQSLCDNTFLNFVIRQLDLSGVRPDRICFEITETAAVANLVRASHFIKVLSGMGCRFALDDFGSGLSSFAYLKNLRVDYLKIDGSFVRDMLNDPIDRALVEAINNIGHVIGIHTIAEFVESDTILDALRGLGVDFAQGYSIAKPAPLDEILVSPECVVSRVGR